MKKIVNVFCVIIILFSFALIINGCKKTADIISADQNIEDIKDIKFKISEYIKKNGIEQRVELNEKVSCYFVDKDGNELKNFNEFQRSLVSSCTQLPVSQAANYFQFSANCGEGYTMKFAYTISWSNNPVLVNPFNANRKSFARFRISLPGNPNAYYNQSNLVSITDLGPDVDFPENNKYSVEFITSTLIPVSIATNSAGALNLGFFLTSDCDPNVDPEIAGIGLSVPETFLGTQVYASNYACSYNSRVFYQEPNAGGYRRSAVFGWDPLSQCDLPPTTTPSLQEVQFNMDNTGWQNFINLSCPSGFGYYGSSFVGQLDYAKMPNEMTVGTHTIKVRYRNWKYNSAQSNYPVPTSANACATSAWSETQTFTHTIN
jgi:hypothetical protein